MLDNPSAAIRVLDEALVQAERLGERWYTPELYRMKGDALVQRSRDTDIQVAESVYLCGIDRARSMQAKSWELRCAFALAKIWRNQNKTDNARELLIPILQWFDKDFESLDMKDLAVFLAKRSL